MPQPDIKRPIVAAIQTSTADFADNTGEIQYVAHLLLSRNRAVRIGRAVAGSGKGASNHPDQQFWRSAGGYRDLLKANGLQDAEVLRVEIDCTLLPCEGDNGCTRTVPAMMKELGYGGVNVRVYSHRDERGADQQQANASPHRYFDFIVGDRHDALDRARANDGGWAWQA
jgi:hypothetical protein